MREKENLNPTTMMTIQSLKESTNGMTPNQFESYCDANGIQTEWLEVSLINFNDAVYFITLPEFGHRCVYSFNGGPIEFSF